MKWVARAAVATLLAIAPMTISSAGEEDASARHLAKKRKHFRTVVEELSKRDVSHLTAEQRRARRAALQRLAAYAERGVFPVDDRFTGFGVPYLIDDRGTRCALAHLIDVSGSDDIVTRLARTHNHAFVPGLAHDKELGAWLVKNGLTIEEAAFIQLPPFTDDDRDIEDPPDFTTPDPDPSIPTPPTTAPTPPDVSGPTTDTGNGRRVGATRVKAPTWKQWWSLNRHTFVDLRSRYHHAAVVTPREGAEQPAGYRPGSTERDSVLAPVLWRIAKQGDDVAATALMALARMGREEDAAQITQRALTYVGKDGNPYRGLMLLAVGLAGTEQGTTALAAIAQDTAAGRKHMASRGTLPEQTRAFAAVALGLTKQESAVEPLLDLLDAEKQAHADLRACCVAALGRLTQDAGAMQRARVRAKLVDGARTRKWHDDVLATVPTALLHMQDAGGLASLSEHLARFRKPTALRQSLALALGATEGTPTRQTVDMLLASSRRDPDPLVRRYAIVSLGQRTPAAADTAPEAVKSRRVIGRFFAGALQGHHVGNADRPWVYLGAALFARADTAQADSVRKALVKAAAGGGDRGARAAAAIALGLVGGADARDTLRELLEKTKDEELRPYVAEALGILGDRRSKAALFRLVRTDTSERVRYRAALGLGYLADRKLIKELVSALQGARSVPVRSALTRVIGEVGDRSAISALVAVATDGNEDDLTRMRAVAALGLIGETANPTWAEAMKRGANRARATPTMKVVLSIF